LRPHAREKLPRPKGLDQVVVRAGLQTVEVRFFSRSGGYEMIGMETVEGSERNALKSPKPSNSGIMLQLKRVKKRLQERSCRIAVEFIPRTALRRMSVLHHDRLLRT
jgi:hypothetical protein